MCWHPPTGAHRGRLDNGFLVDGRTNQISGPKFGTASDTGRAVKYKGINHFSPEGQIPFMFVYKVMAAALRMIARHRCGLHMPLAANLHAPTPHLPP